MPLLGPTCYLLNNVLSVSELEPDTPRLSPSTPVPQSCPEPLKYLDQMGDPGPCLAPLDNWETVKLPAPPELSGHRGPGTEPRCPLLYS
jgi:hypothetical protein